MTPKYRADIDGLRAVAVLSVLFFHSGSPLFSGGYVGVDIFFVISGYLITTIIVREITRNEFSIVQFYERRFRRILPAVTVVVIVSLAVGSLILTPKGLVDLGQSAVATALFSSNVLFYIESGYFDGTAEMKPLLHTWSLAVEEQYYIFFPLLLMVIARVDAKHYLRWLIILGLISFSACAIGTNVNSSAAFYLIPTRAWELFMGSFLALHVLPVPKSRYFRETISILGLMLIAYSVFRYTSDTNFPGIAAAVPTIGSALIIYSGTGGQSLVSNSLSLRPIVFIGLISYSLYLWHWPVIVYTKIYTITGPGATESTIMLVLIFVLSILSWKYIETPFRKKSLFRSARGLLSASGAMLLLMFASGLVLVEKDGLPMRYKSTVAGILGTTDPEWEHWTSCEDESSNHNNDQGLCDIGISGGGVSFILWGDSHAKALASGVDLSAKNNRIKGLVAIRRECPPLVSIERPDRTSCERFNQSVLQIIADRPEIKTVVLAARWALSTKGTRYKNEPGRSVRLVDILSSQSASVSNVSLFTIGLMRTIEELHNLGRTVVIVDPVPEIGFDVPSSYFVSKITGQDVSSKVSPTLEEYRQRTKEVTLAFLKIKAVRPIHFIEPETYLCDDRSCSVIADGVPLYRDDDHLSTFGSKYVSQAFDGIFEEIASNSFEIRID